MNFNEAVRRAKWVGGGVRLEFNDIVNDLVSWVLPSLKKPTRVLFIYTNINDSHVASIPFGLASIVGFAENLGYKSVVKTCTSVEQFQELCEFARSYAPEVIAFTSVMTQFKYVAALAEQLSAVRPESLIVCGGVHVTLAPESLFEAPGLDCLILGEGEFAFAEFLGCVDSGADYHHIQNLAYRCGGQLVQNALRPRMESLDALPFPGRKHFPDPHFSFFFTRGCPFNCSYCSNHALAAVYGLTRNTPRYRTPKSAIQEIEEGLCRRPLVRQLEIFDDTFGIDRHWRDEFLRLYKKRIGLPFRCLINPLVVTRSFAEMLRDAGCYTVSMGVESGNEFMRRKVMRRHMSRDQIVRAFRFISEHGMQTLAWNVIGLPGETVQSLRDTVDLNREIQATNPCCQVFHPYPGTHLGDLCSSQDLLDETLLATNFKERMRSVLKFSDEMHALLIHCVEDFEAIVRGTMRMGEEEAERVEGIRPAPASPFREHPVRLC